MSIILRVNPRSQQSPNSCWWACMRMVLGYYESWPHQDNHPSLYKPEFARPGHRTASVLPDHINPPDSLDSLAAGESPTSVMAPYEWFEHGVPMNEIGLRMLCDITGFSRIPRRPAFGRWTAQDVEDKIRQNGPFLFIGNWNNQGFHAVLVVGREIVNLGTKASPQIVDEVIYIDPAMGIELHRGIGFFNRMMTSVGMSAFNPLYFPASPQLGALRVGKWEGGNQPRAPLRRPTSGRALSRP